MKRTDAADNVEGRFSDGDPTIGRLATVIDASWLNAVQEELAGFIESSGLQLDPNDENQLYKALLAFIANPEGVAFRKVKAVGENGGSELDNTGLNVATDGASVEVGADSVTLANGQKSARITSEIVQNALVLLIDSVARVSRNLVVGTEEDSAGGILKVLGKLVAKRMEHPEGGAVAISKLLVETTATINGNSAVYGSLGVRGKTSLQDDVIVQDYKKLTINGDATYFTTGLATPSILQITFDYDMSANTTDWGGLVDGERVIVFNNGGNGDVTVSWMAPDGGSKRMNLAEDYAIEFICYNAEGKTFIPLSK